MKLESGHHKECPLLTLEGACLCAELLERDAARDGEAPGEEAYRMHFDPDWDGGDYA